MKLLKEKYSMRCDMGTCQNIAEFEVDLGGNKRHNLHICRSCFDELYGEMSKVVTPKSPANMVKAAEERRREWRK
ncbi:MAG: hypothetical protein OSJ67_00260 [Clostridia bacterium]|nr:hypothetical protein [Clostridia bacterium]